MNEEPEKDKKRKKNKNKKKRKNGEGGQAAESVSEVSINDQSQVYDDDLVNHSYDDSSNTRPATKSSKMKTLDFTPLKEKIDDTFFDD